MSYDRLAPAISSKAKGKLFGSGNMGQNNWVVVPLSDGLDTRPCKILDPRLWVLSIALCLCSSQVGVLGPDLQNILRQCYDYLTIMPKLRSTYDGRLIYKTSYKECKASLR